MAGEAGVLAEPGAAGPIACCRRWKAQRFGAERQKWRGGATEI